jgi:hypothetical protein
MDFLSNLPGLDDLAHLAPGEIAELPPEALHALQAQISAADAVHKRIVARFSTALELRYATRAAVARRACGKDAGTVRLADGAYTVIADLPKRVEWDQAQLAALARNIAGSGEDPAEFIDTKLSVAERKYTALPESWRKGFEPARTVKVGALKVTLEPNEATA